MCRLKRLDIDVGSESERAKRGVERGGGIDEVDRGLSRLEVDDDGVDGFFAQEFAKSFDGARGSGRHAERLSGGANAGGEDEIGSEVENHGRWYEWGSERLPGKVVGDEMVNAVQPTDEPAEGLDETRAGAVEHLAAVDEGDAVRSHCGQVIPP